jgi:hypothetical protein
MLVCNAMGRRPQAATVSALNGALCLHVNPGIIWTTWVDKRSDTLLIVGLGILVLNLDAAREVSTAKGW